jgi:hypothetical protein
MPHANAAKAAKGLEVSEDVTLRAVNFFADFATFA